MANLLEILNDPNYVNANLTTKNAIFQKYAPLDENYSKANDTTQLAIKDRFGVGGLDEFGDSPNVVKEVAANVAPSLLSGLGGLAQFPGKLADLVTGTAPDEDPGLIRKGIGAFLPFASTGAREAGGRLEEFGKELKTPTLRRKEKERAATVEAAEGELNKFKAAGLETITDPSLLSSFLFEQAPNALGSAGVGLLTKAGGKLLFKEASKTALNAAGTSAAIATQVAQQGTDVGYDTYKYIYDELVKGGMSKEQANSIAIEKGRVAALEGGAISYALSKIPGAREFEKMLFRDAAKAGVSPSTFLQGLRRGVVGGGASEMGEEGGGKFASNVGIQEVFPEYKLSTGLGETTAMAGIGGSTTSGVFGGLNARAEAKAIKQNEEAIAKANAPFKYVEPQTGTTMTASVTELDDPNLVFVGTQEVGGRQVYVYAPAEGVGTEAPSETSQAAPEGDVAQNSKQMMAEFEGRQPSLNEQPIDQTPPAGQLSLTDQPPVDSAGVTTGVTTPEDTSGISDLVLSAFAKVTDSQPVQFVEPDSGIPVTISLTQLTDPALVSVKTFNFNGKTYYFYAPAEMLDTDSKTPDAPLDDVILQNRDRNNPVSIAQMNKIANEPDYSRVSFSNSFTEGAPVIFGSQSLPSNQLGRKGTVVAGKTNRKIPVQYAVIESDQMVASNAVDGSTIPEYANPTFTGFRAVTNGRVAGLKEGYKRGTMGQYKQDLLSDDIHGISADAIAKMKNPILVRVMPQDQVTADIADESNTSSTLGLSVLEQAKNDANRIDLSALDFREDGAISSKTARGFVAGMPQTEQRDLLVEGQPNRRAYDRLNAAIFYKAYGNEALVSLAAEAKSVDAANIINGLSQAAPQMAQLDGLGEYDIRPQVVEAAEMAVNASRQDQKISDVIAQQDLISQDSIAREILQLFANNTRSAKKIGMGLRRIANDANAEASLSEEPDMLGDVQTKRPAANVVEGTAKQIIEEDIKAKQEAADKAAAIKEKAEAERKAIAAASVKASSEYVLGRSAEDDLSGQKPIFSKAPKQSFVGDKAKVLSVAESVSAEWAIVPDVVVVDDMQSDGIPQEVKDYDKTQTGGTTKNPEGFYYRGNIYLLASQLKDEKDIVRVMNHEVLGHYGLRGLFGEALTPILDQLAKARRDLVQERADAYGLDMNDLNDRRQAAEEALAILAQTRPELGFVKRAVAAIRTWLREHGFKNLKLTDDQIINDYIIPARDFIERGKKSAKDQLADIRYSRIEDQTGSLNFKNWFGNSKVVDANGSPLVVYHGTGDNINIFDPAKTKVTEGIFFTPDAKYASDIANKNKSANVMPVFVSMKNPRIIEAAEYNTDSLNTAMTDGKSDGVIVLNADGSISVIVAKRPEQIKSAIGNTGAFDPNNPDIRYSKSAASLQKPKPAAVWTAPDMNRKDTFIGLIQDRNISLKRVQQVIEKLPTVTQLQDNLNAYRLEDLAHGRVQVQTYDFLKFEFGPIVKEMNDNKVTEEQLTEYLLNRHAKEANELIAKRNPKNPAMQDKGSSVETKVAEDYLKNLPPAQKKLFESLAKKVDDVIIGTQELLYKNGIISKAELDGWRSTFKHYVPLRREETDYVLPSSSFKEIGSYSKSRTGSQKKVTDILSNVGIAREIAIVRSEKEKAKRAVYGLAVANPNPEFWMAVSPAAVLNQNLLIQELSQMGWDPADAKNIMAEPTKAYFNKDTGLVEHKINTQNRYADFVLPVKINGQDRFVFFNPNDKRAASVITALKKADTQKLNAINSYVGNITRYFAAVNTQYNLVFGAWNFVRDVQGAMLNLTTTPLNGKQSAVFQGTFTALKDIYAGIKEKNQGTLQTNPADGSWQDFLEAGGKIGYRDQFAKINDTSTLVARELKSLNRGNAYKAARSMLNWVSSVNDVMENAVRLSAYRVALKQNLSKDQAAEIAKNLTVNFNRKGSATAGLSAYYAFLNASIQGTARLAQTIDPRTKSGKLIIAGGMAIGMAQSLALMAAGFDDDEPSEFLKERNFIIPTGWLTGKRTYAMWPYPLGFNILPNTGRLLIDGAARLADGKGVGDLAINALSMAVSSTNPLGGNAATLQSYMPTVIDPFVAVYENKDSFGRPIAKEDRGLNPTPGYTRSREPANPIFQGIAEFMNTITSRDPDVKGLISPTADQLSYIAEQIGGGVYREASRAVKYAVNVLNGEETPEHQVPLAGKIIGDLGSNSAISQKFYTNVKNMAEHELVIKAHRERRQSTAEYMRDNPEARLWQRANSLENEITKLNKTKKELYQREAPKERIKRVEDQKIRMMNQFNDQVRRIQ
jgi:hypothetical protein